MLEAALLLVSCDERNKEGNNEASRGQKATKSLHICMNQLGQIQVKQWLPEFSCT